MRSIGFHWRTLSSTYPHFCVTFSHLSQHLLLLAETHTVGMGKAHSRVTFSPMCTISHPPALLHPLASSHILSHPLISSCTLSHPLISSHTLLHPLISSRTLLCSAMRLTFLAIGTSQHQGSKQTCQKSNESLTGLFQSQ